MASTDKSTTDQNKLRPLLKGNPTTGGESLLCRIKYNNTLPDIPFDPKFLVNPLDLSRFVQYTTTSLEREAKHDLLVPHDLGVDINLLLPERYEFMNHDDEIPELHPDDQKLLVDGGPDDASATPHGGSKNPRLNSKTLLHNKVVPWLKRTEYISTEFNRYGASSEKTETKVGYKMKKGQPNSVYMDKDHQIASINKTFEACKLPIERHHSKPNVRPVRVLPVLPDFSNWKYPFAQVIFDNEPVDSAQAAAQMEQAIIRGAVDEETQEQYVAYFLPTEITMTERLMDASNNVDYVEDKEYEYKLTREYNWNAKPTQGTEENYFLSFKDDAVYYNGLETRVRLSRRRTKHSTLLSNSTLVVKHRQLNEQELRTQQIRLAKLEPPTVDLNVDLGEDEFDDEGQDDKKRDRKSERGDESQDDENESQDDDDDVDVDGQQMRNKGKRKDDEDSVREKSNAISSDSDSESGSSSNSSNISSSDDDSDEPMQTEQLQ